MKTIGLIGGLSWESTVEYYRLLNEGVREKLGGLHSAKILMYSVDFAEIRPLQAEGRWDEATEVMIGIARKLEQGGADLLLIGANTMHRMADEVQAAIGIPLLHIADGTAEAIKAQGLETVGLLGTIYTMEHDFYRGRLENLHGLNVVLPNAPDRQLVNAVIYNELCIGQFLPASKAAYLRVIDDLIARGAQGIILGCTEIGLLIKPQDVRVPVFDTTVLHAHAAVTAAVGEEQFELV